MHKSLLLQAAVVAPAAIFMAGCATGPLKMPLEMPLNDSDQATITSIAIDPRVSFPENVWLRVNDPSVAFFQAIHEKNAIERTHQGTNSIEAIVSRFLPRAVEDALRERVAIEVLPLGQDVSGADAALMLQVVEIGLQGEQTDNAFSVWPESPYGVYMDLAAILIRNPPCEVMTNRGTRCIEPVDMAKHPVVWRRFTNLQQCKRLPVAFRARVLADDTDLLQREFTNIIWALSQDLVKTLPQKPSPAQPLLEKARTDKQGALRELWDMRRTDKISQEEYMGFRSEIEKL
jgi:hypothetical protein